MAFPLTSPLGLAEKLTAPEDHPLTPTPSPSASQATNWHFPGPSSKYHKREHGQRHTRFGSTVTTPTAPVLSTERRAAHRRTQSYATPIGATLPTTPLSESGRSALARFPSYTSSSIMSPLALLPKTPVKSPRMGGFDGGRLQDSPFSDYFTDDGRSVSVPGYTPGEDAYITHGSEAQKLLVRLNKLASQLMRSGESDEQALNVVRRRLGEIDTDLSTLRCQTRLPAEMEDSGLFMDEEEEKRAQQTTPSASERMDSVTGLDSVSEEQNEPEYTEEQKQAEHDFQRVLENVTRAQEELRKRHAEIVEQNNEHIVQIEERDHEIERLRFENEGLKSDLGFDHSELLYLKLSMKSLEMETEELKYPRSSNVDASQNPVRRVNGNTIMQHMNQWREDWHTADARFKRRRSKYGAPSADLLSRELDDGSEEVGAGLGEGDWRVETVRQGLGRVSSIIVRRLESRETSNTSLDGAADEPEPERKLEPAPAPARSSYANQGCQTRNDAGVPSQNPLDATTNSYADQSVQTNLTLDPYKDIYTQLFPANGMEDDDDARTPTQERDYVYDDESSGNEDEDDCAITTSQTTPEHGSPVLEPQQRSAWSELWEGLGQLAGMREE